jgi:hypothetical protein
MGEVRSRGRCGACLDERDRCEDVLERSATRQVLTVAQLPFRPGDRRKRDAHRKLKWASSANVAKPDSLRPSIFSIHCVLVPVRLARGSVRNAEGKVSNLTTAQNAAGVLAQPGRHGKSQDAMAARLLSDPCALSKGA